MRWGCQRNNQRSPKTLLFVFRRFACRPAAFLSVWGGQPEREASLFNLKFLAARVRVYVRQLADGRVFAAVCGQPVFEVGVLGADEDGGVFLVKIDFGGLFLLGSPVLIVPPVSKYFLDYASSIHSNSASSVEKRIISTDYDTHTRCICQAFRK